LKLKNIYNSIVAEGIKCDPRGKKGVNNFLDKIRKEYKALSLEEKRAFDKERLTNPYSDSRILYGNPSKKIKTILTGIDMETPEVLLADALNKRGRKIDLILSHHPEGFALSALHSVMNIQLDVLESVGVSRKKTKKMLDERIGEVARKLHPANVMRPVDAATLLDIPIMCAHTVADNCVSMYLNSIINKKKPKSVQDIIGILLAEPEYRYSVTTGTGPCITLGRPSNKCGKVIIEMTGGTGGSKKIFPELVKAGVKTIIAMHMSEGHFKKAKKHSLNIIIAGHMSSDSLGVNLLLDAIDPKKSLDIMPCSGFIRVDRRVKR
jgi:putative NIF3 family GTP cyclohydrolase 1 type 2